MKKITKLVLGCLLMLLIGVNTKSNAQAITNGGFETGSISPWAGTSLVTVSTGFTELSWTIVPSGTRMARIEPTSSLMRATAESNLGLSSGSLVALNSSIFGSGAGMTSTNFGTMTQTITLAAGQTIVAYWNYVSRDYTPFNDGFIATLVGPSYQQIKVLAVTANAYGTGAMVTGSYGSTGWHPVTFTAGAAGTYKLGFACFNAGDQALSPIVCIDNAAGGTAAPNAPIVATSSISATGCTSATCGGNVTSAGGATVTARGVCWNTTGLATTADPHTTDGSGTGSFTSTLTGLTAGATYYVRSYATNTVGTSYGPEVTITMGSSPSVTASATNVSCNGGTNGTLTATASGTVTYAWSSGHTTATVSGVGAGTYTVVVTSSCGSASAAVTVAEPSALVASNTVTDVLCNGGSTGTVTVSASGGTTSYTGTGTTTGLAAGSYSYTVTDANGCTASTSATVGEPSALVA
ncbi:MAG: hypothetical protein K9G49_10790, partial [Taibaiella sp.]|nr:hypothetical protein [Taibaiella sp.]